MPLFDLGSFWSNTDNMRDMYSSNSLEKEAKQQCGIAYLQMTFRLDFIGLCSFGLNIGAAELKEPDEMKCKYPLITLSLGVVSLSLGFLFLNCIWQAK